MRSAQQVPWQENRQFSWMKGLQDEHLNRQSANLMDLDFPTDNLHADDFQFCHRLV